MPSLTVLLWSLGAAPAAEPPDGASEPSDVVMEAITAEIDRAMRALAGEEHPPYFVSVEVTELSAVRITGEDGALQGRSPIRSRRADIDVRVGSAALDSSHALRAEREGAGSEGIGLVLDDDVGLLRRQLWLALDQQYRAARERWAKVSSEATVLVEEEGVADLAPARVVVDLQPRHALSFDEPLWEARVRAASATLATDAVVRDGSVSASGLVETRWFASSEGARLRHDRVEYSVIAAVDALVDDGTVLQLQRAWQGDAPDALPDEAAMLDGVAELHRLLRDLHDAPEQPPYSGPVVLEDRAAGVFFHEVFGHRVEGHRLKRVDNAQTFKDMVGEAILPPFLSVEDDPTRAEFEGIPLRGHYDYDNEGAPAERVVLVKDGVLEGFLQSRDPMRAGDESNGHGRRQVGRDAVTRQGNLIVTASRTADRASLRRALVDAARARGLEYGLWIDDIQGGFTNTARSTPNAFDVKVLVAHRVYVDGRPDELVRGIDLIGTPLVAFGRIVMASPTAEVFNGQCGAESGWVPVSAVAPALLVEELETQRKPKGQRTPALLPPPIPETKDQG